MSGGKSTVKVMPARNSAAGSSLTRYIAKDKLDKEREGERSRPLFSERENDLTNREADHYLSLGNGNPKQKDLIHMVVSPEKGEFESLGENDQERIEGMREIVREIMQEVEKETAAEHLCWVSGTHRNTDIAHNHIAISRKVRDRETGRLKLIKHLPRTLLPHNERELDGTKKFIPGKIADKFSEGADRRRLQLRELHRRNVGHEPHLNPRATQLSKIEDLGEERQMSAFNKAERTTEKTKTTKTQELEEQVKSPRQEVASPIRTREHRTIETTNLDEPNQKLPIASRDTELKILDGRPIVLGASPTLNKKGRKKKRSTKVGVLQSDREEQLTPPPSPALSEVSFEEQEEFERISMYAGVANTYFQVVDKVREYHEGRFKELSGETINDFSEIQKALERVRKWGRLAYETEKTKQYYEKFCDMLDIEPQPPAAEFKLFIEDVSQGITQGQFNNLTAHYTNAQQFLPEVMRHPKIEALYGAKEFEGPTLEMLQPVAHPQDHVQSNALEEIVMDAASEIVELGIEEESDLDGTEHSGRFEHPYELEPQITQSSDMEEFIL